jgi:glyoxylase-like metal-dependent hydrolase (beta-lactamase superfamily II)
MMSAAMVSARTITLTVLLVVCGVLPAAAQVDLAGEWAAVSAFEDQPHRVPGPELGDYTGLPINDAARLKARTWDASVLSQPERQAQPHPATYSMRGPGPNFRMNKIVNPRTFALIGYTLTGLFGNADRTIWLDGRPHPSELAEHTWSGFSTGVFEGSALRVTTTHIKAGTIQRNGVPTSPYATMTEFFIRHGDTMLVATIVEDPIYLEEPFVRTSNFVWAPNQVQARPSPFEIVDEVVTEPHGFVPSYPLGTLHEEYAKAHGLPFEATIGGKATVYPEFAGRIKTMDRNAPARSAPPVPGPSRPVLPTRTDFEVLPIRDGVYMLAGPGGNVTVHVSDDEVLIVDASGAADADKLLAAIRKVSDEPVRYIIDTSADPDHAGGNAPMSQAGVDPGGNAPGNFGFRIGVAPIIAHENVLKRLSAPTGQQPAAPFAAWPTSTYFTAKKTMFVGDDPIEIQFMPAAHTDGDSIVFFRRADVISAGDVFMTDRYPMIDLARGGTVQGVIDALNRIIDIAIPRFNQQGGTLIVPGHGRLCNESDVVEYRDMTTIVRDRVRTMVDTGLSLEQVKAARPTLDYDGIYGATTGSWTTDMFVEAVFRDLSRK